jgi:SAM-dependent methyltransferase
MDIVSIWPAYGQRTARFGESQRMRLRIFIKGVPFFVFMKGMPLFLKNYYEIKRQAKQTKMDLPFGEMYPCLEDRFKESGIASGHYFYQDLLVAHKIFKNKPIKHVDIGSRIDGFVAHVASFREIEVFDIRELNSNIQNIRFRRVDLMDRNFNLTDYCDSVSCLHALEHFGLGRYGDRVDYNGHLLGWENIYRMLKKGGKFYFSVPIGEQRIEFDAHRVFSIEYLLNLLVGKYAIDSFSYVNDRGDLITDTELKEASIKNNFSCHYGCGIFELSKT